MPGLPPAPTATINYYTARDKRFPLPTTLRPLTNTTALLLDGRGDLSDPTAPPAPFTVAPGTPLTLTGWAVDALAFSPARGVFFTLDGARVYRAEYGEARYDVARLLGREYGPSGYRLVIPASDLPPGDHTLALGVVASDGRAYYAPWHTLTVVVR